MHPEVEYVGLLTLLYAGTTSLSSYKYSRILNHIVKIWITRSKSAGNNFIRHVFQIGTSETIRDEITTENIKNISIHIPKHLKPCNDIELGQYLAGLIDGNGHFSSRQELVLVFNSLDIQSAYYIRERINHGLVRKVQNKNAVLLIVSTPKGIERVINLINNKFRTTNIFDQITNNILASTQFLEFSKIVTLGLNTSNNYQNHWIAGFSDACASFQIKILIRNNRTEVLINYQIDHKNENILIGIKNIFGGNTGYIKSPDTYYYGSTNLGSAKKVIKYLDRYHLLSTKHINYLKWRKVYILIQNKEHLTVLGQTKIKRLKSTMNRMNTTVVI